jgi:hypothetical protein
LIGETGAQDAGIASDMRAQVRKGLRYGVHMGPGESHLREGDQREIGLIWRMAEDDRKRHRLFFTGSGLRNQCLIVFYPGRQTGMVVFTNDVLPDSYLEELSDSVLHDLEF